MENSFETVNSFADKPMPPRGPTSISAKSDNSIVLNWKEPESDGGAALTEHVVERQEVGKKSWKQVGTTQTTSIEIKGLKKEKSYNFRVIAKNKVGCSLPLILEETYTSSSQSTEVKTSKSSTNLATTTAATSAPKPAPKGLPGKPGLSVKDVTSRSVTLQWTPPSNTGGVELTSYIIQKRLSSVETWEKVATVEPTVTLYTVENLKEKSDYLFQVSAENEMGAGEAAFTEKISLKTHASKWPPKSRNLST